MKNKRIFQTAVVALSTSLLFACNHVKTESENLASAADQQQIQTDVTAAVTYSNEDDYEAVENAEIIELNGSDAVFDSSAAVLFEEGTLTIKAGGTYLLTGNLDGQIVIDAEDKNTVRLVLDDVSIRSDETSAIFIQDAEKAIISLEEGSENLVADAADYTVHEDSDEPNAAIYSKSDLTINGSGQLVVEGNYNNGISSKDSLKITGGEIDITAVDDALMGRDLVAVKDGLINIEAGDDGIKTTNDEETTAGTIVLEGGTYSIHSGGDGIQSAATALITDGTYTIQAGSGSPESVKTNTPGPGQGSTSTEDESETGSAKGLKANATLSIGGGTFMIDSLDDSIHSNEEILISGGDLTLSTGEDGIHADQAMLVNAGSIDIAKSYEGLEAAQLTINGGDIIVKATDDGINVSDGSSSEVSHALAENNPDDETASSEPLLTITDGFVAIDAGGDGLDANGSIDMTGGTVLVNGPTTDMEGAIDYDNTFTMDGGLLVAAGSAGMVQSIAENSSQASVVMTFPEIQEAGTLVNLADSTGTTIVSFAPEKMFQAIFIGSPDLEIGSSYTLSTGGSSTGEETEGLFIGGTYQGGTEILSFVQEETATWLNENGITEASPEHAGGPAGQGGRPKLEPGTVPGNAGGPAGTSMREELDEETTEQIDAILSQLADGSLTQEEAEAALEELGIRTPIRPQENNTPE
ncbi:carbohydrate-binding domain-containing protein [Jeotgalibacillus sp. JSM ZJ347]|uniref:carbohydrate-binding domain-containing protein n=1 Tax=Jeotgalibacillus sp. JSM ZJ347 TaxID=3342117 RepID=UPI0035A87524